MHFASLQTSLAYILSIPELLKPCSRSLDSKQQNHTTTSSANLQNFTVVSPFFWSQVTRSGHSVGDVPEGTSNHLFPDGCKGWYRTFWQTSQTVLEPSGTKRVDLLKIKNTLRSLRCVFVFGIKPMNVWNKLFQIFSRLNYMIKPFPNNNNNNNIGAEMKSLVEASTGAKHQKHPTEIFAESKTVPI